MASRLVFLLIAAFWVTMNVLLWRSEFGGKPLVDSAVPVQMVWERMLTAQDQSVLDIWHDGKEAGYCRWSAQFRREPGADANEAFEPEGQVKHHSGYRLNLEGSVQLNSLSERVGFDLSLVLSTNQVWEEFAARILMRPDSWAIRVLGPEQKIFLSVQQGGDSREQTIQFSDLQDPQVWNEFGGGLGPLPLLAMMSPGGASAPMRLPILWEARSDWLQVKNTKLRVYRLHARMPPRYEAVLYVSRAGEILRAELPEGLVLINQAITF
jgi:hypothetical protein